MIDRLSPVKRPCHLLSAIPYHFPQTHFLLHPILTTNQPTMSSFNNADATSSHVPDPEVNVTGNGQVVMMLGGDVHLTVSTDPL